MIQPETSPSVVDLRKHWAIVHHGPRSWVGKYVRNESDRRVSLQPALEYLSHKAVDPKRGAIQSTTIVLPCEMLGALCVSVPLEGTAIVDLADAEDAPLEDLRQKILVAMGPRTRDVMSAPRIVLPQ
jgi:hypothetical protein